MTTVAQTILDQLGGSRFLSMTGATNLVAGKDSLKMTLPARLTKDRANMLSIWLLGTDEYHMQAYRYSPRKLSLDVIAESGIFQVDQLRQTFERLTGLRTSL